MLEADRCDSTLVTTGAFMLFSVMDEQTGGALEDRADRVLVVVVVGLLPGGVTRRGRGSNDFGRA